ncbi:MAG TPA: divalent-cation tolerance protein CutA [Thermopolyspora sp.]|jgi:Uncharacterized protein involved in tolerance to divalent cations
MAEYLQVQTTVESEAEGARLARSIVEARLAACVQVTGPVSSVYRWQGEVEETEERQLFIKTAVDRFPELEAHINAYHSYDTPEIIAVPITGSTEYLEWISQEITRTGTSS